MRLAIHVEPILYITLSSDIGRQCLTYSRALSPFSIQIIIPSFCVQESSPFWNAQFKALATKGPIRLQNI